MFVTYAISCHPLETKTLLTPVKPVTVQFADRKTKAADMVWKEFPLCAATAKP